MQRQSIRNDSPTFETVGGRKYTTCHTCDDVIDLTPDGQFTFETVVYGNGFAIRAYCSLTCLDRMIRPAVDAVLNESDDDMGAAFPEYAFIPR